MSQRMIQVKIHNGTDADAEVTFAQNGNPVVGPVHAPPSPPATDTGLPGPGSYVASANGMISNICQVEDGKIYRVVLDGTGIKFEETKQKS